MRPYAALAACVGVSMLIGCSEHVVKSEAVSKDTTMRGLVYSLPKGQMAFTASRTQIRRDVDIAKAKADVAKAQAAVEKHTIERDAARNDPVKLAAAELALKTSTAQLEAAKANLGFLEKNEGLWQEVASVSVLPIVPDPSARFVADLDHQFTRDDQFKLTAVNGLLTSTKITSTDQTPNLIIAIADTIITGINLATGGLPKELRTMKATASEDCAYSISEVFDPLNRKEMQAINAQLSGSNARVRLNIGALDNAPALGPPLGYDEAGKPIAGPIDGLVYRVATPVVVKVERDPAFASSGKTCELAAPILAQAVTTLVPDSRSSFLVSSMAGPFTTTTLEMGFSNGMLTDYSVQRPSELAGIASIPVTIANHIMTIPTQLMQLRVNYDTQATARVNAQTALKQAQVQQATSLTTAMTALVNAQTALSAAQINQPGAVANAQLAVLQAQEALRKAIEAAAGSAPP